MRITASLPLSSPPHQWATLRMAQLNQQHHASIFPDEVQNPLSSCLESLARIRDRVNSPCPEQSRDRPDCFDLRELPARAVTSAVRPAEERAAVWGVQDLVVDVVGCARLNPSGRPPGKRIGAPVSRICLGRSVAWDDHCSWRYKKGPFPDLERGCLLICSRPFCQTNGRVYTN